MSDGYQESEEWIAGDRIEVLHTPKGEVFRSLPVHPVLDARDWETVLAVVEEIEGTVSQALELAVLEGLQRWREQHTPPAAERLTSAQSITPEHLRGANGYE